MAGWVAWANQVRESIMHHPHINETSIEGVPLFIQEQAVDMFGRNIQVIVLASPEDKITGRQFGPFGGAHANIARQQCILALTKLVNEVYHNK